MIYQEAPRRSLRYCSIDKDKGFWIEGKDYDDCIKQLREYGKNHPEKWIYFYNCGAGPAYPIPVARYLFEVAIYDREPASLMFMYNCFQKGRGNRREIEMLSDKEKNELRKKQLEFFYTLGSMVRGKE